MLSKHPLDPLTQADPAEAIRLAIIAELDAINLYTQLARSVADERVRKLLLDIAREEKTHVGELLALLRELDEEQARELLEGEKEVRELLRT